jgi:cytochrome c553
MTTRTRLATIAVATLAIAAGGMIAPATAQQQMPELPEEVKSWMERDQVFRWAQLIQKGKDLYTEGSCGRCHGPDATGTGRAPDLTDDTWVQSDGSLEGIRETVMWGVRRRDFSDPNLRFEMNPSGGMDLEWDDMAAVAAYVWTLSNGTFLPQRGE